MLEELITLQEGIYLKAKLRQLIEKLSVEKLVKDLPGAIDDLKELVKAEYE